MLDAILLWLDIAALLGLVVLAIILVVQRWRR
jgi:hypothetical protein